MYYTYSVYPLNLQHGIIHASTTGRKQKRMTVIYSRDVANTSRVSSREAIGDPQVS